MTESKVNQGINMSGGSINADQLVVGERARAIKTLLQSPVAPEWEAARKAVLELTALLEKHQSEFQNPQPVMNEVQTLSTEIKKPNPDRSTIAGVLEQLAKLAPPVAAIVEAVAAVAKAIGGIA